MSVGAQVWKHIIPGANPVLHRKPPIAVPAPRPGHAQNEPAFALMHQLFFPSATLRRTSILLAAADSPSKASSLRENIAVALAQVSGGMVGIIESASQLQKNPWKGKGLPVGFGRGLWQMYSSRLAERVWQIPITLIGHEPNEKLGSTCDGLKELRSAFDYFLLSANINDCEMPGLCNLCEAAVLVLTANVTRREAALKAKEQLLRQGVTLLGTVLDQRTMPIPESIYRRL
ncbi:MAG: hypothetical protein ACRD3P_04535 [Terriglobales bacterium]